MADSKRRVSGRSIKRKSSADEEGVSEKKVRPCNKAGCCEAEPSCCLFYEGCTKSGYTSRWYHMTLGEHFCNNCFDNIYRPGRVGNIHFSEWSNEWSLVARITKPTVKLFVANELLPYWVKCTLNDCGKWRMIRNPGSLDTKFIQNFKCSLSSDSKTCDYPEDKSVALASNPYFASQLVEPPLLKNSPAGPYLKRFLPEDIGMCPTDCTISVLDEVDDIEPFSLRQCGEASIWPKPDRMDEDESIFVADTLISPATYLGMRNLIVALWNLSPKEWLSLEKVNVNLVCRGLVRIFLLNLSNLILKLLIRKSVINYGIIENPLLDIPRSPEKEVLIIGAGISGLAAGRHLHNLGVNVTIFEANCDIGGRVLVNPLTHGAYLVHGLLNNPFRVLSIQADQNCQKLKGKAVIFDSHGKTIPEEMEIMMQHQLRGIAQGALEGTSQSKEDCCWYNVLTENFKKFSNMVSLPSDDQLFHHLLELFEIELGADLRSLSLTNWEAVMAVKGANAFLPGGLKPILDKLAKNLDIVYNTKVKAIDYAGEKIKVATSDQDFSFSKVLVTVPLPALRGGEIDFTPPLPHLKQRAFNGLGDYYCAKLILQFPERFWVSPEKKLYTEFSIVSSEQMFQLFLDVTVDKKGSSPTLMVHLSPKTCEKLNDKCDMDIVDMCMKLLEDTFGKKRVSSPTKWYVTDWKKKGCNSYGSYFKVGSKQTVFDDMAAAVDNKLFFAGEATFRNIPGSMTGAYLSGLREATKILEQFEQI